MNKVRLRLVRVCCAVAMISGVASRAQADFAPKDANGCVLWLKADAGIQANSNGGVTNWVDQSGKGHDISNLGGTPPVLSPGPNGKPVVRFDGNGYLYGSHEFNRANMAGQSIFLLARWTETNSASCQRILSSYKKNWGFGFMGTDKQWIADEWVYLNGLYGQGSVNTNWHLLSGTIDSTTNILSSFWEDDTILQEEMPHPSLNAGMIQPGQIELNGVAGDNQKSKCEIAEVIMYDRVLSDTDQKQVWKYFSKKYRVNTPVETIPGATSEEDVKIVSSYVMEDGPYKPDWRSFKQYECPEWFRDAKFGIWAHWSPQCQPEFGDWYAYHMYREGSSQYQYHVAKYGHPSTFGYKDVCNAWKADKWDPEKMIQLYKRAGAKYFVALANHHCNFDCWDSKYQPWNSVNIGPKKDIVGTWAKLARQNGLRFGVTVHNARTWDWFHYARGSDTNGPLQGVPYDGILTKADGKGQWWEGYDPADLYGPYGTNRTPEAYQAFVQNWYNRTKDLVDKYQPDLLYFDDTVPPLGAAGMQVVTHFLNSNLKWHNGKQEGVYNTKIYDARPPREIYQRIVKDFEGGRADAVEQYPWQTDTCIGNWHYFRGITYRKAIDVVHELVDIASKNGNLLLNIPVRGDGSLDDDELKFIADLTKWMDVNGESIFGTRPWRIYSEGERDGNGKLVNNGRDQPFAGTDIRFVSKGKDAVYATLLAWPGEKAVIKSLSKSNCSVRKVALLGHPGELKWTQTDSALEIEMPHDKPCEHAFAFRITGKNLSE